MTQINRKIHVVGINSFKFEELPLKLQTLFTETVNIAVPNSYFEKIKLWSKSNTEKKKLFVNIFGKMEKNLLLTQKKENFLMK